jgi:ABC-2 type transport system permease protein
MMALNGVIFRRTLRDSWKGILGWGILLGYMGGLVVGLFPYIEDILAQFGPIMESPFIKSMVGDVEQFATLEAFLGVKLFSMLPLFLGVYVVLYALGMVAGEEERGTLDVLLSTPASRGQMIVEKLGSLGVSLAAILSMMFAGILLGAATLESFPVDMGLLLQSVLNILPVTLFMAGFTLLLTTLIRPGSTAGGIAAAIIFVSYFMTTLTTMVGGALEKVKYFSFYYYYNGDRVITDGIHWPSFFMLLVLAFVLFGASIYFFQRRDLYGK